MSFIGNNAGAALSVWQQDETILLPNNLDLPPDTLVNFANSQFAYGAQIGVDPTIYMFAALGVGEISASLATRSGQAFWGDFSPTAMSDSLFVYEIYNVHFGRPQAAQFNAQLNLLQWYENLYSAASLPQPDLLARGAFIGIDLGIQAEMPYHIVGQAQATHGHLQWL